jgi:holin-like protein
VPARRVIPRNRCKPAVLGAFAYNVRHCAWDHTIRRLPIMLLRGLSWLVLCQLLGTALNVLLIPILPGPIIGMLLLFGFLLLRGEVGEPLREASGSLLKYLPLLLVPPAVGVMAYATDIFADFWAIVGALLLSLMISIVFAGWLMQKLIDRQQRRKGA